MKTFKDKSRLMAIVELMAAAFIAKAQAKTPSESPSETLVECIEEELLSSNHYDLTFREGIDLVHDHMDLIMVKVVEMAHTLNPSHDCKACVLMYLCEPSEDQQKEHKEAASAVGMLDSLDDLLASLDITVAREGFIPKKDKANTSEEDADEQMKIATDILKNLLKNKKK